MLSRFLAALTPEPVEALRTLFLADLLARSLGKEEQPGGLTDRADHQWMVFDGEQIAKRPEFKRLVYALHLGSTGPMLALMGGFLLFHILEKSILIHFSHEDRSTALTLALIVLGVVFAFVVTRFV